jgi:hypothetical protein
MASATLAKFDAKGDHAGLLHLDIHEIKGIVVEDDLNDWSIALDLGQQVAQREHGEASVAANSDGLAAGIRQLRAEGVGRGVGHGGPGKGAKQAAISAAHEVPGGPDASGSGVDEKHGVIGGHFVEGGDQELGRTGLISGPLST